MSMGKLALAEPLSMLIFGGALERHPGLQMVLVEGGFGWLGYYITQMDTTFTRHRYWTGATIKEPPSFYFHRQVRATFIEDKAGMRVLPIVGAGNVMWSSDYPHSDSTWPNSRKTVAEQFQGVPPADQRKIVAENAAALYGLT
jgi:predicted TIM-barrel fold metal-dependent hydrolase